MLQHDKKGYMALYDMTVQLLKFYYVITNIKGYNSIIIIEIIIIIIIMIFYFCVVRKKKRGLQIRKNLFPEY